MQGLELVEGRVQDAELVDPAGLRPVGRHEGQLCVGRGQQEACTVANGVERLSGLGIALALT
ncbi:hypothetical protein [Streptomyces colonosanans]|uniref:Uncharacterized protein n=1 Tax=Streptomyces colonosanans TaxID=1428652 RepID=A0A1S2NV00_9ACTN|nr:hypothetical protein [Streptomyces colonosanans]OIJ84996.1 hypothetical protein BIV24_29650 [Streptomyces colonosanans]